MATLIARYLINEGSGSTLNDSSGNGNHLTINWNGNSETWTTISNGSDAVNQPSRTTGSIIALASPCPAVYEGAQQLTTVMVLENMNSYSGGVRGLFIGTSSGNGHLMVGTRSETQSDFRWKYEVDGTASYTGRTQYRHTTPSITQLHVIITQFDLVSGGIGTRIRNWFNNVETSEYTANTEGNLEALSTDLSWTSGFSIMNRAGLNAGYQGDYSYVEVWDGLLTAQERQDATDALLLDSDTAWDGPPPTSVSFTQQPTSTAITETSVTAQATAESDASDPRPPVLARYLLNEGSGTTIADSSGNGHDMTLTDAGDGGWSSIATGTTIYSGTVFNNNVKAQSDSLAASFAGKSKLTLVLVIDSLVGNDSVMRMVGTGSSGDGSYLTLGARGAHLEMRWHGEPTWNATETLQYRLGDFSSVGGMTAHMVVIVDIDITRDLTDKVRWYLNDNLVASDSVGSDGGTPLSSQPSYVATLLNRGNADRAMGGHIGYIEWWDGLLTDEQKTAAYTALIADCDTAW